MHAAELWLLDDARIMGGGQLFALRLARHVADLRDPTSVCLVCPDGSELARRAATHGIPIRPLDFPPPAAVGKVFVAAIHLARMIRGRDALIVAGSARCQAVAVAAGAGGRLVHLMHERESADRLSVRLVQRRTGRVVTTGAVAARAYGSASLRNFLLDEDFLRLSEVPARPRTGVLGVLGRMIPEKGILELVQELRDVSGWRELLIAGPVQDPAYAERVQAAADDRTQLLGEIPDAAGLLARVDALVVPSVGHEGQPTVIIEALAAGRPVIVREALSSPDYEGLPLFAYGDLAAALGRALTGADPDRAAVRERFGAAQALAAIEDRPQ